MKPKLSFSERRAMSGQWRSTQRALKKYHSEHADLLGNQIAQMIREMIKHRLITSYTNYMYYLPEAVKLLSTEQLRAGVDMCIRLVAKGIDPGYALQAGVPAAANNGTPQDFPSNLSAVEQFLMNQNKQRTNHRYTLSAIAKELAPEQFRAALNAALDIERSGIDVASFLGSLPALAKALDKQQFMASIDLAIHLAANHINPGHMLSAEIPNAAKTLSWEQLIAGIDLVINLAERGVNSSGIIQYGVLAAVKSQRTPEDLQANIEALESYVLAGGPSHYDSMQALGSLPAAILTPERFKALLETITRLVAEQKIDPAPIVAQAHAASCASINCEEFQANLQALINLHLAVSKQTGRSYRPLGQSLPVISITSEQFRAAVDLAARLIEKKVDPTGLLQSGLPAAAKSLDPDQFLAAIEMVERFASQTTDPEPLLRYAIPAAIKCSTTPDETESNIQALEHYLARLSNKLIKPSFKVSEGLEVLGDARSSQELKNYFRVLETLVSDLAERKISIDASPGLVSLARQAVAVKKYNEGFQIILHPALTSEEYIDDYYGGGYSTMRVDHPEWIGLRPVGNSVAQIPLEPLEPSSIKEFLEERSWLWRHYSSASDRERAVERITHFCSYLPATLDQLMRAGVLEPGRTLVSAYLIGSYPWVANPSDLDLFLIVEGELDVAYFNSNNPAVMKVETPGLGVSLSAEVVGVETLIHAAEGMPVKHAKRLSLRYALIYGSALLSGRDLFKTTPAPKEKLAQLEKDILEDAQRSNWPELEGDRGKIYAKRDWRQREARALAEFLESNRTTQR